VLLVSGPLSDWLQAPMQAKGLRLAGVVLLAVLVYFGSLWAAGLRPRHLRAG
jgi:hypothetical protein